MSPPRLTIVIPSFNQSAYIKETLESVFTQDYANLEVLVLDGGSTDGSLEIIREYESRLTYFRSRRDAGQLDALVEGFSKATGDLLGWVNSDDVLFPYAISAIAAAYTQNPKVALVGGNYVLIDHNGCVTWCKRHPRLARWFARYGVIAVNQPGSFFTREAYESAGGLSQSPDYVMDTDLYFKILRRGSYLHLNRWLSAFRIHTSARTVSQKDHTVTVRAETVAKWTQTWPEVRMERLALASYRGWQVVNGNYMRMVVATALARRQHWYYWSKQNCLSPSDGGRFAVNK